VLKKENSEIKKKNINILLKRFYYKNKLVLKYKNTKLRYVIWLYLKNFKLNNIK
jgi:hypothetical protein